ncbi:bis-aminopropyl spermidine synthase family protein [Candidatus Bipolaricaulota bacterium]|nr:bis-aminopropyl spermidine synthase family protein [Candidatus Bipolaricaulota bacterium]
MLEGRQVDLGKVADGIRRRTGLAASARDIERVLAAALTSEDIWRIVELAGVPLLVVCAGLECLAEAGWVEMTGSAVHLTPVAEEGCARLRIAPARTLACPRCGGRGVETGLLRELAAEFPRLAAGRPDASQEFDQGYVTEETTIARIAAMWAKGDLEGKDLLVLGDDDLVSLAAARSGLPRRVAVLDADPRITSFIAGVTERESLAIEVVPHDLRAPLPSQLERAFDTFACDPTESLPGFLLFAGRGLSALRGPGCAGYLGLTHAEASLAKWQAIQRQLLAWGAVITDLRDGFHAYVNWPYVETMRAWARLPVRRVPGRLEPWYRSALLRIELVTEAEVNVGPVVGDIFVDDEAATT